MLLPIFTSKELHFNTDFKYIIHQVYLDILPSVVLPIKSYEPEKVFLILENKRKHLLKIIKSQQKSHHKIQHIRGP